MPSNAKNVRKCCVCHGHADKSELLRFVRTPDGQICFDETGKADGRGVWIHDRAECKVKAVRRKILNAAFKTAVAEEVYGRLETE